MFEFLFYTCPFQIKSLSLFLSQVTMVTQEVNIEVAPEGSLVHRHTAMLLDLKNRANVIRFMNVIVDETPVIPYEVSRSATLCNTCSY